MSLIDDTRSASYLSVLLRNSQQTLEAAGFHVSVWGQIAGAAAWIHFTEIPYPYVY
jgi:hypothetical protein